MKKLNTLILLLLWIVYVAAHTGCAKQQPQPKDSQWVARAGPYSVEYPELINYVHRIAMEEGIDKKVLMNQKFLSAAAKRLLANKVLLQKAKAANVIVPDSAVEQRIKELKDTVGEEEFAKRLQEMHMDETAFKKLLWKDMMIERYLKDFIISRVVVDDSEIEQEYELRKDELKLPERVRVRQIVVRSEEEARKIKRDIYKKRLTFKEAAKRFSIAPEGKRGGDLGWFAKNEMPPFFAEHCFNLTKGRITGPIESPYGFHLFMLMDKSPEHELSFEEAKPKLYKEIFERKKRNAERAAYENVLSSYVYEERIDKFFKNLPAGDENAKIR